MPQLYVFLIGLFVSLLCLAFLVVTLVEFRRLTRETEAARRRGEEPPG